MKYYTIAEATDSGTRLPGLKTLGLPFTACGLLTHPMPQVSFVFRLIIVVAITHLIEVTVRVKGVSISKVLRTVLGTVLYKCLQLLLFCVPYI